eukprot:TRINITY_DN12802_c0_g1_i2.p1 TRINITY_DN12802_c0_g1~~TRINITY_DN12802_c0_g1_i2.p1  ORF type:complete len:115 (+),score=27.90 TRINITY_DN12802_c0_g1_i2:125-469(+)
MCATILFLIFGLQIILIWFLYSLKNWDEMAEDSYTKQAITSIFSYLNENPKVAVAFAVGLIVFAIGFLIYIIRDIFKGQRVYKVPPSHAHNHDHNHSHNHAKVEDAGDAKKKTD